MDIAGIGVKTEALKAKYSTIWALILSTDIESLHRELACPGESSASAVQACQPSTALPYNLSTYQTLYFLQPILEERCMRSLASIGSIENFIHETFTPLDHMTISCEWDHFLSGRDQRARISESNSIGVWYSWPIGWPPIIFRHAFNSHTSGQKLTILYLPYV